MKSTVDYSVLWDGDEDAYSEIDSRVDYLKAAYQATNSVAYYCLPSMDIADWLDLATSLAQERLLYAYVKGGKIATMDGYRLHVYHSPETIPDGVYWLVDDKLVRYDKPKFLVPDWESVIPTRTGQKLLVSSAVRKMTDSDIWYLEWTEPFKYRLRTDYWRDATVLGGAEIVWAESSTKACVIRFDGGMAVIMSMHPDF